jgi:hypothetical protein
VVSRKLSVPRSIGLPETGPAGKRRQRPLQHGPNGVDPSGNGSPLSSDRSGDPLTLGCGKCVASSVVVENSLRPVVATRPQRTWSPHDASAEAAAAAQTTNQTTASLLMRGRPVESAISRKMSVTTPGSKKGGDNSGQTRFGTNASLRQVPRKSLTSEVYRARKSAVQGRHQTARAFAKLKLGAMV